MGVGERGGGGGWLKMAMLSHIIHLKFNFLLTNFVVSFE